MKKTIKTRLSQLRGFTALKNCKRGNFAMMAAIFTPVLLLGASMSLDVVNLAALKGRMQAATDSVSLAVATRINKGTLDIDDAEDFASKLLLAQMESDTSRFSNLVITPQISVTKIVDNGVTTYNVDIGGTATQDTTPLASLFGKNEMSVAISSGATAGTEEIQGALSLSLVVDVSGSMGWELPDSQATKADVKLALDLSNNQTNKVTNAITRVMGNYGLDSWQVKWIAENYKFHDCKSMAKNATSKAYFLNSLNLGYKSNKDTWKICQDASFGTKFVDQETLVENIRTVISYHQPTKKIEALQDAAAALFAQLNTADPTATYVRTGLSAYSSYIRGTTNMEWGTGSAATYIEEMYASGGTASTKSVKWAYDQLKASNTAEDIAHTAKNGQTNPDKFILFMTDGSNNRTSDDTATKAICDTAKSEGIRIFAVAFAAPTRGQQLLSYCATSSEDYFEPETADELIAAFERIGKSTSTNLTRLTH
ncbi:MAG: TadE/TadG family type IV pilus assembly protein [Lentilitoribacter sp.]